MRPNIFILLSLFLASLVRAETSPIKIGVIAPLSGEVATWGTDVKNVMSFALRELNAQKVEVIYEDDRCLGKDAVTAAHKLVNVDKIDYAMIICTESTLSVAPILEKAKIVMISPAAGGAAISQAGDYIFRTWPSSAVTGKLLADYVVSKHQTFGILSEDRGYPQELASSFKTAVQGSPFKLIAETFQSEDADFRSVIKRFQVKKVEGIFINTNAERAFVSILTQLRQLNWSVPIYGVYMPGNRAFLELAGDSANGIIFVAAPSAESSLNLEGRKLYSEFVSEYGELQSSSFVFASTFEALQRIMALRTSSQDERKQLYGGHFSGIFGDYSFDENGDIVGIQHQIKIIKDRLPAALK